MDKIDQTILNAIESAQRSARQTDIGKILLKNLSDAKLDMLDELEITGSLFGLYLIDFCADKETEEDVHMVIDYNFKILREAIITNWRRRK